MLDELDNPAVINVMNYGAQGYNRITDRTEKKLVNDFIKFGIGTRNPVYYPFIINQPLLLSSGDKVYKSDGYTEEDRSWFYFEVEIVRRLGGGVHFVIGLLPAPYPDHLGVPQMDEVWSPSMDNLINPESDHAPDTNSEILNQIKLNFQPDTFDNLNQPEWVKNYFDRTQKGDVLAAKGVPTITEWKHIVPGDLPDSVGFDVTTGRFKVSGGLEWAMDVDQYMKEVYDPDNLYKTALPKKSMAEKDEEATRKFQDEDDEGMHFVGDSFGIAFNARTGRMG